MTVLGGYFKCMSQEFLQLDTDLVLQSCIQRFLQNLTAAIEVYISAFSFSSCVPGAGFFLVLEKNINNRSFSKLLLQCG